ncbi:MAG: Endonuclease [Microgenomates group bacterium GW2011_GWC1_41_8]|uniref:Endonuclease n=3 Tax=Candidatus Roizmaniibacteriota TaxID=1752723 RepID=A0A0G0XDF7_9BACT|nr:MAG: Endonuclease [Candidatus Levybacteria bacterium GW2011_GWA2_40_16]KKR72604.1 MAG: Endonuclease [Candidatus Roizmanbacteria bacterium GW2011_GWB1_40_7]KKR95045.1 MAG: Endonuclease [Candidatus Roizmanbacteria bacterium GW2011_GWA1_41_13]KKS22885.1 MAG: Endonuclease [Candidatus Roizmanbacteria bacterium GW2011_GWC2_41_7]KKS24799.1 MAG: Endonuclease [Microgenomates group bacterium GW2011_GWC1_41_8]OGK49085.1 MAG: hypothetical protein A3A55_00180 [Candidatus Roizmanbacteria bacterium RIFCSP
MAIVFSLIFLLTLVLLPVGLIWPSIFQKIIPGPSHKKVGGILASLLIFAFIFVGVTRNDEERVSVTTDSPQVTNEMPTEEPNQKVVEQEMVQSESSQQNEFASEGVEEDTPTPEPTNTPIPTMTPTPTTHIQKTPTFTPLSTNTPTPYIIQSQTINTGGSYTCSCSKTCEEISSCQEAYYQLNTCGCGRRDGDNDGVPCENLCE